MLKKGILCSQNIHFSTHIHQFFKPCYSKFIIFTQICVFCGSSYMKTILDTLLRDKLYFILRKIILYLESKQRQDWVLLFLCEEACFIFWASFWMFVLISYIQHPCTQGPQIYVRWPWLI